MIEATPMGYRFENAADLGELRVEPGPVLIFPLDVTVVQIQHATDALSAAIAPAGGYTPPIAGQDALSAAIGPAGGYTPPIAGQDALRAAIAPAGGYSPPITGQDALRAAIAPAGGYTPPIAGQDAFRLDRSEFLLLEAGHRHRVKPLSPSAQVLTLLPSAAALEHMSEQYHEHVARDLFQADLAKTRVFSRTRWVDELANRYLFERRICNKHRSEAARFLETELLKELYFFCREAERPRASVVHEGLPLVNAVRAWIEQHLFELEPISQLAERFNTSASSLLRAFKRELGVTPVEYLRARRLDEALLLVQSGKYTVTEVAFRASYQNLSAFSVAFRKRFGISPSGARGPRAGVLGQSPSAIGPRSS